MIYNFSPITVDKFAEMVVKSNPSEKKIDITKRIKEALEDVKNGDKCDCGNPIWVAGSAFVGHACFTCITGETDASEDYEIEEAIEFYNKFV